MVNLDNHLYVAMYIMIMSYLLLDVAVFFTVSISSDILTWSIISVFGVPQFLVHRQQPLAMPDWSGSWSKAILLGQGPQKDIRLSVW